MLLMLGYVLFRVGRLQTIGGEPLREAGADQWTRQIELEADRGTIFDRNGEELAVSIPAASISVNPKLVSDPDGTVRTLATVLGLTDQEQADLYAALVAKDKGFVYVKRQVDVSIGQQIADLELSGVNVDPEDRRVLPGGETGRSVIGLTDIDGDGIAGLELQYGGGERGDELGYTDILDGMPGELTKEVAPKGRSIPGSEQVTQQPVPGDDIILTLDRSIQFAVEEALLGPGQRARRQVGHGGRAWTPTPVTCWRWHRSIVTTRARSRSRPATWPRSTPTSPARWRR